MRRGPALVLVGVAVLAGVVVGTSVVPDRATVGDALHRRATAGASDPTPSARSSPSPAAPSIATGPVEERDLLSVKAFHAAGLRVTVYPQNGNTSPDQSASNCTGERTVGSRTLGDITGHDPQVFGTWDDTQTDDTASEIIATAEDAAHAAAYVKRLVSASTTCQHEPASHWVYGVGHTAEIGPGIQAHWFGQYVGDENTTGQAPKGAEPCGGVLIVQNGDRFGIAEILMCADSRQLEVLAKAAATRLG